MVDLSFIPSLKQLYQPFLDHGYTIYLVGGAVRDLILGQSPKDLDFTTDAPPEKVMQFFRRTIPTGLKHGTVTVLLGSKAYEVTTFRTEGDYTDHRRPKEVIFTPSLEEDLKRRDFTINGLALSLPAGTVADFHGGRQDLHDRVIRAIGRPADRFDEDALRILRACRFAARLNFTLEEETWKALQEKRHDLVHLSAERVREELNKTTGCSHPGYGWRLLRTADLLAELNLAPLPTGPEALLLEELLDQHLDLRPASRWALILKAMSPNPESWLKQMTFSNQEIKEIMRRLKILGILATSLPEGGYGEILYHWGSRDLEDLKTLLPCAAALGHLPGVSDLPTLLKELERKAASLEAVFLKELAIQGETVMGILGWKGGPWLGRLLQSLLEEVWKNPQANSPTHLESRIREYGPIHQPEESPKDR